MTIQPTTEPMVATEERLAELKDERERAFACAFLSFAISLALVLSNFPGDRKPIEAAGEAVTEHTKLLSELQKVVQVNEEVLVQNQKSLADVRKAAAAP